MMPLITLLNDTIDMVILNKHTNPDKQKPEMGSWNILRMQHGKISTTT